MVSYYINFINLYDIIMFMGKQTQEHIKKRIESRRQNNSSWFSEKTIELNRNKQKERWATGIYDRNKMSILASQRLKINNPMNNIKHLQTCLSKKKQTLIELKFEKICFDNDLPFKYVGSGELIIGNKCPDFVHKSKKLLIEIHSGGGGIWKKERDEIFLKNKYECLYISNYQMHNFSESKIVKKIQKFLNDKNE